MKTADKLSDVLLDLLGEEGLRRLAEFRGGARLYVSAAGGALAGAIGAQAAGLLAQRYAGSYIRVPLAREIRARHYRGVLGLSNAAIARRLGITESGVDRLFQAMPKKPEKNTAQGDLFR